MKETDNIDKIILEEGDLVEAFQNSKVIKVGEETLTVTLQNGCKIFENGEMKWMKATPFQTVEIALEEYLIQAGIKEAHPGNAEMSIKAIRDRKVEGTLREITVDTIRDGRDVKYRIVVRLDNGGAMGDIPVEAPQKLVSAFLRDMAKHLEDLT